MHSNLDQYLARPDRGSLPALGTIGFLAFASLAVLIEQIHSQRRYALLIPLAGVPRILRQSVTLLFWRPTGEPDADDRQ